MIHLDKYGWDGCSIPPTLEGFFDRLPTWKNLRVLRPPETHGSRSIQFPWTPMHTKDGTSYLPGLQIGEKLAEGSYGEVFKAQRALYIRHEALDATAVRYARQGQFEEIVVKQNVVELTKEELLQPVEIQKRLYEEEIQASLFEATLHAIVYQTLEKHGFCGAVPKLYEVVAVSPTRSPISPSDIQAILIPMEFVEGQTLYTYFESQFHESDLPKQRKANDRLLMDILIQLCMYLDILQTDLRFNHRDLKVNNVIRRNHPEGWSRILTHTSLTRPWLCMNDIVLIDFGFSCIACGETNRSSLIQAGSWFRQRDDCMKRGRDIALFLYCLHSCFPLRGRITEKLWECLKDAMCGNWETTQVSLLEEGVNSRGIPTGVAGPYEFDTGIYRFMRLDTVQIPKCEPKVLLLALDSLRKN